MPQPCHEPTCTTPPGLPPAETDAQTLKRKSRIDLERTRIFFDHARGNMVGIMIGAAMVAIILHNGGVSAQVIAWWGLLFNAACGCVLWFERWTKREPLSKDNYLRRLRLRIGLGVGVTLFYGVSGWMLPEGQTHLLDILLFTIMTTVVTVGCLSFAVMPAHYLTLAATTLVPLMGHFLHRFITFQDDFYLFVLLLAFCWLAIVLSKARAVSRTAIEAIALNQQLQDEIEEHKRTREAMRFMALHDALTGLGNRRHFDQVLTRSLSNAQRAQNRFGLIALDLNDFKPVNDRLGHAAGDALLQSVARRLQESVREGDFCARLGGDEFALLLFGPIDPASLARVTEHLRERLQTEYHLDPVQAAVRASASIGWAVYPDDGTDFANLMGVADARMYGDKQRRKAAASATLQPAGSDRNTARTGDASAVISRSGSAISS